MAITIDTHIPAASSSTEVNLPVIDWSLFKVDSDKPQETVLRRVSTGKSNLNEVVLQARDIQDVYNNTWLQSSSVKNGTRSGSKAFIKNNETWSKVDSADPTYEIKLPNTFECDVKLADDPLITSEVALAFCDRSYAIFRQQVEDLLLGVNNPKVN